MIVKERQVKTGFLLVTLAGALWGTTGPVSKYIYAYGIDSLTLAQLRIGISFFALLLYAAAARKKFSVKLKDLPFFLGFGAVSVAAFNITYLTAIRLTSVTTAVVLLYTAPAFSLLAAFFFLREDLTIRKLLYLFFTLAGIVLVVEAYKPEQLLLNVPGVLNGLGAGLTYGLYSIFSKGALKRGYTSMMTVIFALGSGTLWLAVSRPPWHLTSLSGAPLELWLYIFVISVFSTMLAYVFFVHGLEQVEAGKATLVAAVEPVVAIILAVVFLQERMSVLQLTGIVTVLATVWAQAKNKVRTVNQEGE